MKKIQSAFLVFFFAFFDTLFNNLSENRSFIDIHKNQPHAITDRHTDRQISKIK